LSFQTFAHFRKKHVEYDVFCSPSPSEQGTLLLPVLWEIPWRTARIVMKGFGDALAAIFLRSPGTAFLVLHLARSAKEQKILCELSSTSVNS